MKSTEGSRIDPLRGGARTLVLVLATRDAKNNKTRVREEDAAIDAEDILTQAEEANTLDPVG
jgi:hypothetical protein